MSRLRIGVLASGSGTTFQNLVERCRLPEGDAARLDAEVAVLVVSKAEAYAKVRAETLGVPCVVLPKELLRDAERLGHEIARVLDAHGAGLCAMAGFLKLWAIPPRWAGRVLNVHPALLPAFGGHNMYGHFVHESVVASGVKVTGCTVHFADDAYDQGPIVLQRVVPVTTEDTADTVAARVQEAEREAYPEAIQLYAEGRLRIDGRRVRVLPSRS